MTKMTSNAQWILFGFVSLMCTVNIHGHERVPLDQMLVDASKMHPKAFNFFHNGTEGIRIRTELDIMMTIEDYDHMQSLSRQKRTVGVIPTLYTRYWTNNVVYYRFAQEVFPNTTIDVIRKSINEWSHYTCLNFQEDTSFTARNYIHIIKDDGCYSYVGMIGNQQELSIGEGCQYKEIVLHEFGHALGLHHEQNHPERDNHLTIVTDNIPANILYNFRKQAKSSVVDYGIPYDYLSLMHYSGTAFGGGKVTMVTKDPKMQNVIGLAHDLSFGDVKTINFMYQCKPSTCRLTNADCPGTGFVGKDCRCWCEGHPVKYCFEEDRKEMGVLDLTCEDQNPKCSEWYNLGYCTEVRYRVAMLEVCKKTCTSCISD